MNLGIARNKQWITFQSWGHCYRHGASFIFKDENFKEFVITWKQLSNLCKPYMLNHNWKHLIREKYPFNLLDIDAIS